MNPDEDEQGEDENGKPVPEEESGGGNPPKPPGD